MNVYFLQTALSADKPQGWIAGIIVGVSGHQLLFLLSNCATRREATFIFFEIQPTKQ